MMLKRLQVENIRSYEKLDISFEDGVTVVSGVNGSGKSSLLESCFTGLFGSKALDKEFVLSDMVRKGATKASINLQFTQNGHDYEIEQVFRNDPEKARATNTKSLLKKDGAILSDQANRSYDAVRYLLNMDEDAYKNCVYIRQGEIDLLINSKPKDRQKMIDDLLQLGKLEEYRERASSSRKGVGRLKRDANNRIKDTKLEIENIESSSPLEQLHVLKSRSLEIDREFSSLNEKRDYARSRKDEVLKQKSEFKELGSKKDSLLLQKKDINSRKIKAFDQIGSLEKNIGSLRTDSETLKVKAEEMRSVLDMGNKDLDVFISELDSRERIARDYLSQVESKRSVLNNDSQNISNSIAEKKKQIDALEKSILQGKDKLVSIQSDIEASLNSQSKFEEKSSSLIKGLESLGFTEDKIENLDEIAGLVADQQRILHGKERELFVKITEINANVKRSQELLEKGKCPTCGQELAGSSVEEHSHLDSEKEKSLQSELSELKKKQEDIELKASKLKDARNFKNEFDSIISDQKVLKDKISNSRRLFEEHGSRITEDEKKKEDLLIQVSKLKESHSEMMIMMSKMGDDIESATKAHLLSRKQLDLARALSLNLVETDKIVLNIKQLEDKIVSIRDMIVLFDSQIVEKQAAIVEISEKMGTFDVDELESKAKQFASVLTNIELEIKKLDAEKLSVSKQIGMIETELKRLSGLKDMLNLLKRKSSYIDAVYSDAEELEAMYIRIRADLRSRNIGSLDALINEIFSFMYSNNAYSHILLDHDYNLTVFGKDGTPLEPKLLSGGERAIFNLVLRCAIYRLLSMGNAGISSKAALPPLIMDEPTVFLDKGHVQQLIKLVDMMRDIGVAQILLVSHDESLIDSADHVFVVDKDPVKNNSLISPLN